MEKNVKVYFEESGDIRRFVLRSATQQELFKQLSDAIGSFWTEKNNKYDLLYKDEENDLVKLSTPQEFEVCASCPTNREILRVFVRKSKPAVACSAVSFANSSDNVVWKRVSCDKCGANPLEGVRYKCIVCPDYDECSKCFRSSRPQHPHALLALNDPNAEEWKAYLRHGMRRRCGEGHAGARRCGGGDGAAMKFNNSFNDFPFMQYLKPHCDAAKQFAEQMSAENAAGNNSATTSNSGEPKKVEFDMEELLKQAGSVFQAVVQEVGKVVESTSPPAQQEQTVEPVKPEQDENEKQASEVAVEVATVPAAAEAEAPKKTPTPGTVTPPVGWTLLSEAGPSAAKAKNPVEDCIATLKQLGFNTDKAWLRELVQQSEGSLNRVLDELTPGGKLLA